MLFPTYLNCINRYKRHLNISLQNFVDLAGSERASQALSVGHRLKEGCHINRSLLTLSTVIRKLRFVGPFDLHFLFASCLIISFVQSIYVLKMIHEIVLIFHVEVGLFLLSIIIVGKG